MNDTLSAEQKPTNVRYVVLGWACSLSMLTYVDRVCIKDLGGQMQSDLQMNDQELGFVFSAFGLAYALFEVPSGWLGDRYGPRQVLIRIVLWWSLFTALTGCIFYFRVAIGPFMFTSLMLLLIVRFLFGMGEAGAYPNAARALRNWFPYSRRGLAQGLLWMFGRWGGSIAPMLILFYAMPFGWRGAFIGFGLTGVLWVIFFAYFFRNSPSEHPSANDAERAYIQEKGDEVARLPISWARMLRSKTLWCLSGMYLFSNAGWCFFITWDKKYYQTMLKLDGMELGIATSAPLFFGGVACLLGGFVTDRQVRMWGPRWGRTLQGFLSYFLGGSFFLLALAAPHPYISVSCLCIASFFKDFAMAVSWATCLDVGHRYSGTVAGFMNGVGNMGTFFGPTIVAYLAGHGVGDSATQSAVGFVGGVTHQMGYGRWDLAALLFSATMFFLACVLWLFINPRKVIVYAKDDHALLKEQGVIERV